MTKTAARSSPYSSEAELIDELRERADYLTTHTNSRDDGLLNAAAETIERLALELRVSSQQATEMRDDRARLRCALGNILSYSCIEDSLAMIWVRKTARDALKPYGSDLETACEHDTEPSVCQECGEDYGGHTATCVRGHTKAPRIMAREQVMRDPIAVAMDAGMSTGKTERGELERLRHDVQRLEREALERNKRKTGEKP